MPATDMPGTRARLNRTNRSPAPAGWGNPNYKSNPNPPSALARPVALDQTNPPAHPNPAATTRIANQTQFPVRIRSRRRARPNEPTGTPIRPPQPELQIKPNSPSASARPVALDQTNPPAHPNPAAASRITNQTQFSARPRSRPNETCMSAASRRFSPPDDQTQSFRTAAWPLEKTNPLWRPAKENKGIASRRQSISEEPPQAHRRPFPQTAMPTFISGAIARSDRGARSFAD